MDGGASPTREARLVLRNDSRELIRLASFVEDYARRTALPSKATFAIDLCLDEAISNVMRHGARCGKATGVVATLRQDEGEVTLFIEDDGGAFDPTLVVPPPPPTSLEEATIGGFGVHLMREFSSWMRYERTAGKNRLIMTFSLARYAPAEGVKAA